MHAVHYCNDVLLCLHAYFVRAILRYRTLLQFSSLGVCNGYRTFPERLFFLGGGVLTAHLAMRPFAVSTAAACCTHTRLMALCPGLTG